MFKMIQKFKEKLQEKLSQKGQGMVEYAIIIAVVAIIAVAVLGTESDAKEPGDSPTTLSGAVGKAFSTASDKINKAGQAAEQSEEGHE